MECVIYNKIKLKSVGQHVEDCLILLLHISHRPQPKYTVWTCPEKMKLLLIVDGSKMTCLLVPFGRSWWNATL